MRGFILAVCAAVLLFAGSACNTPTRYATLSLFFDGVPPPEAPEPTADETAVASAGPRKTRYSEHGPYAAKACNGCHQSMSGNSFVAPRDKLCLRCHELKLDKKYLHGPLAAGGCLSCHDPHSSQYRFLLLADADTFCFRCHDRALIESNPVHTDVAGQCTVCHDPHASDNERLLR